MGLWDMIAMVTLTVFVGGIIFERMKSRERIELARLQGSGNGDEKYAALEERVRVLERLVTDKAVRLKDEIDAL